MLVNYSNEDIYKSFIAIGADDKPHNILKRLELFDYILDNGFQLSKLKSIWK